MSIDPSQTSRQLPERPNLRHLKEQAKDLLRSGAAASTADAQFQIARRYGFASWPKLKAHVEELVAADALQRAMDREDVEEADRLMFRHPMLQAIVDRVCGVGSWVKMKARVAAQAVAAQTEVGQLKRAIDTEDLDRIKAKMTANPGLHRAPLGYGRNGPLTWVAECRVPWQPPSATRLAMAAWMIDNGSDVHQGGDGPLMRAALNGDRIPMMELLVTRGASVNAMWAGKFPIVFAACEAVDPVALTWLLDHGANPNVTGSGEFSGTALDYVIGSYARSPRLGACIDVLLRTGGRTKYNIPAVLDLLCGRLDRLREQLAADPVLIHRRFPELDFGTTGGRMLTLKGATLLHVAAEYQNLEAVQLLLDLGADVNARATVDHAGVGGQTAIFHAATQREDAGIPVVRLLLNRGADLSIRVKVPGHYERPDEILECTPLGYALRFKDVPHGPDKVATVALLQAEGASL
jgi:ankyrin repeat protein